MVEMDLGTTRRVIRVSLLGGIVILLALGFNVSANLVFPVTHKFKGRERSLGALKDHDARRHGRFLSAVDLPLGGNGHPSETGLYYAKIGLGTPSKDYHVQVDTGSDILWVNCVDCTNCPAKSSTVGKLTLFDPKKSSTSAKVTCDQEFCTSTFNGRLPGCKEDLLCLYDVVYGDGSTTTGYYVKDDIQLHKATGNDKTETTSGSVVFGCGAKQSGMQGEDSEALDGILGFGQSNASIISQLASSGMVKREFAHCLDNVNGGGIYAIGEVVEPKVKNITPMVPNQPHYNVVLKTIEVGAEVIELPTGIFGFGDGKGAVIDSGTTLAYINPDIYDSFMKKILARQPNLKLHTVEDAFTCFEYSKNVNDGFPVVKFNFKNSATLTVYPHDYLFRLRDDVWCSGWQKNTMESKDGNPITLLGDLVLSNKLVTYDLENQAIGWADHNCSSSIKVKDEKSGNAYSVGAHNLSSASSLITGRLLTFLLLVIGILQIFN